MKYCVKCGTQLEDEQAFCHNCGTRAVNVEEQNNSTKTSSSVDEFFADFDVPKQQSEYQKVETDASNCDVPYKRSGLSLAASIMMWLTVATCGFLFAVYLMMGAIIGSEDGLAMLVVAFVMLIPLCWILPMTLLYNKAAKNGKKVSLAFEICTLLFVNTFAGILMLVDSYSQNNN